VSVTQSFRGDETGARRSVNAALPYTDDCFVKDYSDPGWETALLVHFAHGLTPLPRWRLATIWVMPAVALASLARTWFQNRGVAVFPFASTIRMSFPGDGRGDNGLAAISQ
jgi:hypothetical protein